MVRKEGERRVKGWSINREERSNSDRDTNTARVLSCPLAFPHPRGWRSGDTGGRGGRMGGVVGIILHILGRGRRKGGGGEK